LSGSTGESIAELFNDSDDDTTDAADPAELIQVLEGLTKMFPEGEQ
jgi:hypothetical protein